jgi:hypothetical protein
VVAHIAQIDHSGQICCPAGQETTSGGTRARGIISKDAIGYHVHEQGAIVAGLGPLGRTVITHIAQIDHSGQILSPAGQECQTMGLQWIVCC